MPTHGLPSRARCGRRHSRSRHRARNGGVRLERADLAAELETRLEAHPLGAVLTSMPGLGVRTAIKIILTIIGDGSAFPTAGHLATYAGLAPVTRRSGSSIKGETRSQRGNHALKSALFLSTGLAGAGLVVSDAGQLSDASSAGVRSVRVAALRG